MKPLKTTVHSHLPPLANGSELELGLLCHAGNHSILQVPESSHLLCKKKTLSGCLIQNNLLSLSDYE
jgi:hypothetical protein